MYLDQCDPEPDAPDGSFDEWLDIQLEALRTILDGSGRGDGFSAEDGLRIIAGIRSSMGRTLTPREQQLMEAVACGPEIMAAGSDDLPF